MAHMASPMPNVVRGMVAMRVTLALLLLSACAGVGELNSIASFDSLQMEITRATCLVRE